MPLSRMLRDGSSETIEPFGLGALETVDDDPRTKTPSTILDENVVKRGPALTSSEPVVLVKDNDCTMRSRHLGHDGRTASIFGWSANTEHNDVAHFWNNNFRDTHFFILSNTIRVFLKLRGGVRVRDIILDHLVTLRRRHDHKLVLDRHRVLLLGRRCKQDLHGKRPHPLSDLVLHIRGDETCNLARILTATRRRHDVDSGRLFRLFLLLIFGDFLKLHTNLLEKFVHCAIVCCETGSIAKHPRSLRAWRWRRRKAIRCLLNHQHCVTHLQDLTLLSGPGHEARRHAQLRETSRIPEGSPMLERCWLRPTACNLGKPLNTTWIVRTSATRLLLDVAAGWSEVPVGLSNWSNSRARRDAPCLLGRLWGRRRHTASVARTTP
mmetsp:Transcript_37630/g.100090  ORF Transcript_37630/g.100090 Transcript_37630/m.100090 type:complete len:380 (-) Transcript_37630:653-1792(-)